MAHLRDIGATLIEMACTRVELGASELAEARWRLTQQALAALLLLYFASLGLLLGVLALAWWAGPAHAALVLAGAAALAFGASLLAFVRWRGVQRGRTPLLHETLTQLRADARALQRGGAGSA